MALHQLLSYAAGGDAVTNHARAMQPVLGGASRLLAHVVAPDVDDIFDPLVTVDDLPPDELVLYHVTIGCRAAVDWLRGRRYGLVYHNITPASFFDGLSAEHERLCREGRDELASLVGGSELTIADSAFNAREIEALGGRVDAIQPPITTAHRLRGVEQDPTLAAELDRHPIPDLLYVGQCAPHKRPEDLVMAHHLATRHLGMRAALALVGSHPVPAHVEALRDLITSLGAADVAVTGPVSDAELATRLPRARALVTASVHEGYCVPVVEAMAAGVPVVARAAGAIPETTDGAALLVAEDAPASVLAEAMHRIVSDDDLHAALSSRGRARAAEIDALADPERLAPVVASFR